MSGGLVIRSGGVRDVAAMDALRRSAEGGPDDTARLERYVASAPERCHVVVGEVDGRMVGWAISRRLQLGAPPVPNQIPDGWYLMGVVVARSARRAGVAKALTLSRLRWLRAHTGVVRCFTTRDNVASLRLHTSLGFVEIPGPHEVPGLAFRADRILMAKELVEGCPDTLGR